MAPTFGPLSSLRFPHLDLFRHRDLCLIASIFMLISRVSVTSGPGKPVKLLFRPIKPTSGSTILLSTIALFSMP